MRLVKVGVRGYKRFRTTSEMDVDGKLIAVVGANEAGKTSLLKALLRLNEQGPSFSVGELTRNAEGVDAAVWARYIVDDNERDGLQAEAPEAKDVRRMIVTAHPSGALDFELDPNPSRDLGPRHRALKLVEQALGSRWLKENDDEGGSLGSALALALAQQSLDSQEETLSEEALDPLRDLQELLGQQETPKRLERLPDRLSETVRRESRTHPRDIAIAVLDAERPRFRLFDEAARLLASHYSLDEAPNQALHNFLALAGTSWQEISDAYDDSGKVQAILDRAATTLDQAFSSWKQAELRVRLRISDRTVSILVRMRAAHDYIEVESRSDGLQQFIALRAYLRTLGHSAPPVLLIDEAETHLHYDAQADLVDVLAEQEDAAKVIYTTHSAGCLPPDLGTGVRLVLPKSDHLGDDGHRETDDSEIENWFWRVQGKGTAFTPLLLGMGASTFAFASTRKAVIAEGGR